MSDVETIKDRLSIVDVLSGYIKVEKAGINWKAKCPFHNEKTPSFFISSTRQSFYCFGCGEKGDIFSFVEKFEGVDFKGALQILADRAGVELKKGVEREQEGEKDALLQIMERATTIYEKELKKSDMPLAYLKTRGVSESTITKWRLGFAQDEWRNLHDKLVKEGFSKKNMLEAGLIKKVDGEEKYYDTFRGRAMFPISDNAGRVIAFSGRIMKDDPKAPKYLNSPETKLFYKSEVLHGFHIAKNYIRKLDYAVLVEGQMDLIMSHQAGVLNTVASSGTALTETHLKKIQKLSNRVIIAYDSDAAGEKASRRAAELALALGMETKIASLKTGEDPASIIKTDPEIWKEALRKSEHVVDFALNKALQKTGRELSKEILQNVLPLVSLIKSEIEKSQFVKKIALKIKVGEDAVWNDLKKVKVGDSTLENKENESTKMPTEKTSLEKMIVGIIFLEESKKDGVAKKLKKRWQEIAEEKDISAILQSYEGEREAMMFEAELHGIKENTEKDYDDILARIEKENLKNKLRILASTLDDTNISKKEEIQAKKEFEQIQKRIKELGV